MIIVLVPVFLIFANIAYQHVPVQGKTYEHVVFVPGIKTKTSYLFAIKSYLAWHLPNAQRHYLEGYYDYTDRDSLHQKKKELESMLNSIAADQSVAVLTHSYGGVLLGAVLAENSYQDIERIITMASPLAADESYTNESFVQSRNAIGYESFNNLYEVRTLCGSFDTTVKCEIASFQNTDPTRLGASHPLFLFLQIINGRKIIGILKE